MNITKIQSLARVQLVRNINYSTQHSKQIRNYANLTSPIFTRKSSDQHQPIRSLQTSNVSKQNSPPQLFSCRNISTSNVSNDQKYRLPPGVEKKSRSEEENERAKKEVFRQWIFIYCVFYAIAFPFILYIKL